MMHEPTFFRRNVPTSDFAISQIAALLLLGSLITQCGSVGHRVKLFLKPFLNHLLKTCTEIVPWICGFFSSFSGEDILDHQVHVWQLWQHLPGKLIHITVFCKAPLLLCLPLQEESIRLQWIRVGTLTKFLTVTSKLCILITFQNGMSVLDSARVAYLLIAAGWAVVWKDRLLRYTQVIAVVKSTRVFFHHLLPNHHGSNASVGKM